MTAARVISRPACVRWRAASPATRIEILVPDFRGRMDVALERLAGAPPDVFNHNLETVPRLYRKARPGSDYEWSLDLLERFKAGHPEVPTKSGLMVGLGETYEEIVEVMRDLRRHRCEMLTIGQYLQPSRHHLAVERFREPEEFDALGAEARASGSATSRVARSCARPIMRIGRRRRGRRLTRPRASERPERSGQSSSMPKPTPETIHFTMPGPAFTTARPCLSSSTSAA